MVVIIPAYQPDEKLYHLVLALREKTDYDLIVVNDGSDAEMRALAEMEIPETKANVLSKNNGENPRMYDYYFDAIKKMNRDRDKKNDDE